MDIGTVKRKELKILFVFSGNSKYFKVSPFIESQSLSLDSREDIQITHFSIEGKGLWGYIRSIPKLRELVKQNSFDLIHSHYSFSGWVSILTFTRIPKIISLMGSDINGIYSFTGRIKVSSIATALSSFLIQFFVKQVIVKSESLRRNVIQRKKYHVIPNGVNTKKFFEIPREIARNKLGLALEHVYILFLGDIENPVKNYTLFAQSCAILEQEIIILAPYPINPDRISLYLNASNVLALTSFNEGSPNVIKEALSCQIPIVSTDVGDVKWMLEGVEGCYLANNDERDYSEKLAKAIHFSKEKERTNGRERIFHLGLDNESIAEKLSELYKSTISL